MGGSTKVEGSERAATAPQQISSWLRSYPSLNRLLSQAAETDLRNMSRIAEGESLDTLRSVISAGGAVQDEWGRALEGETASEIRGLLARQVLGELQAGTSLTPEQAREFEQAVRAGQVARGITGGNTAVFEEAATKGSAGVELANRRRAAAQAFLDSNAASRPSAVNALLGLTEGAYTGNSELMGGAVQANMRNAEQHAQLKYNASAANAQARAQANQGLGGMLGSVAGAGLGYYALGGPMGALVGGGIGNAAGSGLAGMF